MNDELRERAVMDAVDDIFTTGQHEKAIRLKMVFSEQEGGTGWGKQAIADKLRNVFDAGIRAERERIADELAAALDDCYDESHDYTLIWKYVDELREAK